VSSLLALPGILVSVLGIKDPLATLGAFASLTPVRASRHALHGQQGVDLAVCEPAIEPEYTLDTSQLMSVVVNKSTRLTSGQIIMKPLVPNLLLKAEMFANQSSFVSGRTLSVNTDQFIRDTEPDNAENDYNGNYDIQLIVPSNESRYCMKMQLWQENQQAVNCGESAAINGTGCEAAVWRTNIISKGTEALLAEITHVPSSTHSKHPIKLEKSPGNITVADCVWTANNDTVLANAVNCNVLGNLAGLNIKGKATGEYDIVIGNSAPWTDMVKVFKPVLISLTDSRNQGITTASDVAAPNYGNDQDQRTIWLIQDKTGNATLKIDLSWTPDDDGFGQFDVSNEMRWKVTRPVLDTTAPGWNPSEGSFGNGIASATWSASGSNGSTEAWIRGYGDANHDDSFADSLSERFPFRALP